MTVRAWTLIAVLSVLWGGSFLFNRVAVAEIPPFTLVWFRVAIAGAVLTAFLPVMRQRLPTSVAGWRDVAVMGLLNNVVPFVLIVWAQRTIDGGLAAILNALTPIFAVVFTHLMSSDKATPAKLFGVLLGLAGVAVLVGPGALALAGGHVVAELAVVAATMSYGLSAVWSRRFRGRPPLVTASGQLIASTVMLAPLAAVIEQPWTLAPPGLAAVAALLALAVLSTSVAYLLFFRIITLAGAANATLVTLLIPVSAILLTATLLGERLQPHQFLGMAVIASGLLAIDGRVAGWLSRRSWGKARSRQSRMSRDGDAG